MFNIIFFNIYDMEYIYRFTDFSMNEEFTGLINLFKGIFKTISAKIQKMNDDPNKIKEFITTDLLNVSSADSLFKKEEDKFRTDKKIDDETCFNLIDSILNKDSGIFGKQGIGLLLNDKSLQGDKMKVKRLTVEYIIGTARDQVIKKLKYDQKKNIERKDNGFIDKNYLPTFKDMLLKNKTDQSALNQNIENVIKWVNTYIADDMVNIVKAIKEDDINAFVKKGGGTMGEYKVGDTVRYKMKEYEDGVEPDQQKEKIGTKKIEKIENDVYTFKDKNGIEFTKTKDQILGKAEAEEGGDIGQEQTQLKQELGKIKDDPTKMGKVLKYTNFLTDPANTNKKYVEQ